MSPPPFHLVKRILTSKGFNVCLFHKNHDIEKKHYDHHVFTIPELVNLNLGVQVSLSTNQTVVAGIGGLPRNLKV